MKHVCFIVSDTAHKIFENKVGGGAERQVSLIAKELVKREYKVSYIVGNLNGNKPITIDGIEFWDGYSGKTGLINGPKKIKNIFSSMKKINADTYFIRGIPLNTIIASAYIKLNDSQFIYSSSNDCFIKPKHLKEYNWVFRKLYLNSLNNASTVIAQTKEQKNVFQKSYNIDAKLIPNGYTLPPKVDLESYKNREYILWVGRLDKTQKKPHRLFDIADELNNHEFKFICIPGPDEKYNEQIRTNAEKRTNLSFEGFVPPNEMDAYYKHAKVLINTSDYEGFPNTFLEAWRYGTPVVSLYHDVNGLLSEGCCGKRSGSIENCIKDTNEILSCEEKWKKTSESSLRVMEEKYSISKCVDLLEEEL